MTAYLQDNVDVDVFNLLNFVLLKHRCRLVNIDLEHGILDIAGESIDSEKLCQYELQKTFYTLMMQDGE